MPSKRQKLNLSPKHSLPFRASNKLRRQELHIKQKKVRSTSQRQERSSRRKEEERNPRLLLERRRINVPNTLERKRVWDEVDSGDEVGLGVSVDLGRAKRQKREEEADDGGEEDEEEVFEGLDEERGEEGKNDGGEDGDAESEKDSMIDSSTDTREDGFEEEDAWGEEESKPVERPPSPPNSTTSTNLNLVPDLLAQKFPSLFSLEPKTPKILITTGLRSTLHYEAELLTKLFSNAVYIPRMAHRFSHKFSVREICKFASNRLFTAVIVLMEDQKKPSGLDVVHLPEGPHFHFSMTNWIEGKKIPGHGRPTDHADELLLNGFKTPLGLLTAHLFRSLFKTTPELEGRQVTTIHNQRDFLFVRRHRYVFREKKATEKVLQASDGKPVNGLEGIRVGMQELGPRFTLKLRRIDKGIQRQSGQEWEWKGKTDRVRTKFQL